MKKLLVASLIGLSTLAPTAVNAHTKWAKECVVRNPFTGGCAQYIKTKVPHIHPVQPVAPGWGTPEGEGESCLYSIETPKKIAIYNNTKYTLNHVYYGNRRYSVKPKEYKTFDAYVARVEGDCGTRVYAFRQITVDAFLHDRKFTPRRRQPSYYVPGNRIGTIYSINQAGRALTIKHSGFWSK